MSAKKTHKFYGHGIPRVKPEDLGGKLIAIEGADGSGRSTQIAELVTPHQTASWVVVPSVIHSFRCFFSAPIRRGGRWWERLREKHWTGGFPWPVGFN